VADTPREPSTNAVSRALSHSVSVALAALNSSGVT
jgi:hypothetical protein